LLGGKLLETEGGEVGWRVLRHEVAACCVYPSGSGRAFAFALLQTGRAGSLHFAGDFAHGCDGHDIGPGKIAMEIV
jgi:hypothetical protein